MMPDLESGDFHGRPQKLFQGGQSRHFAYPFWIVDDATQVDVHKTLQPFYTPKKMPNVTAAVAYSVFPLRKFCTKQMLALVSMDILRLSYKSSK